MAEFLLEIGLEEVPARMIASAAAELMRRVVSTLRRANLMSSGEEQLAVSYASPRRLAVYIPAVYERQADTHLKVLGPSAKIAFKDGQPTPAAEAFARNNGVNVSDLTTETLPKGDYVVATKDVVGKTASEVICAELPKEIAALSWAKNMYWRPGKPERFVRPVEWLACLLGDTVVPLEFAGVTAGRTTFGHRVLAPAEGQQGIPVALDIVSPASYAAQLEGEFVLADPEARRHRIRKALDRVCRTVPGARWREDVALVDELTYLTEWPAVLLGGFDPAFLALPEEVLVTAMRGHQKYFALEGHDGRLLPHFLTVLNIALDDRNEPIIRGGNERVLRARFNDARFFWNFDGRTPLADRVPLLANVTFQKDLGSYAAKSERIRVIAATLSRLVNERASGQPRLDATAVDEAARFAKTDLTAELVKEFTELQGVIGGLYALAQGLPATVAAAIYDQYLPASATDPLPRSAEGTVLGLADRIDTLASLFRLGLEPTGSRDPFALRRAANAVVRLLAESGLPLRLSDVIRATQPDQTLEARLNVFFAERVSFYLREIRGQAYDVAAAAAIAGADDLRDLVARAEAVTAMRASGEGDTFLAVAAAFKRMRNILEQALEKGEDLAPEIDALQLLDPAELDLADTGHAVARQVEAFAATRDYFPALVAIARLRPVIDAFFDRVMVMAPEPELRRNRLALLARTVRDFSRIADFSEIVVPG